MRNKPAASRARDGNAICRPGMWAKIDSPHWLCQIAPPCRYPPIGMRTTIGQVNSPFDRHRVVAASDLIWFIAGQT